MKPNPAGESSGPLQPARPSATLVLLRDGSKDLEVLLLRRSRKLSAFPGAWVFPGGVTEPRDHTEDDPPSSQTAARNTAVRELKEETGLDIDAATLVPLSRWTAPEMMPRRFDTWYFLGEAATDAVRIDHREIHDHRWTSPDDALAGHRAGRIALFPPTWVTLYHLAAYKRCAAAMAAAGEHFPYHFAPRVVQQGPDTCFLYGRDAAYGHLRIEAPGPRHRLWVRESGWLYERSPVLTAVGGGLLREA